MSESMKQTFGLKRRPWCVFYLKNKITGQQTSLKTSDQLEVQRVLQAHSETENHPVAGQSGMAARKTEIPLAGEFK
jgi:hypothetical protein